MQGQRPLMPGTALREMTLPSSQVLRGGRSANQAGCRLAMSRRGLP